MGIRVEQVEVSHVHQPVRMQRIEIGGYDAQSGSIQPVVCYRVVVRILMQEQLQGQSLHVVFDEFKVVFRLVDSSVTFPDVQLQQFDDGTIEWFFLPAVDVPLADDVKQFLDTAVHQLRPAKE